MAKVKFSETESSLIALFKDNKVFEFNNKTYKILQIGKPSPSKGECKTDIYILAESNDKYREFKISVKQSNADFLENKIKLERAIEIFGSQAQTIIKQSILQIKKSFEDEVLINFEKKGRTEAKCITLGWKFELFNKLSGKKSALLNLNKQQKIDVYSGTNLDSSKTNCLVNGTRVVDSGIAEYILETEPNINKPANYYISKLVAIDDYVVNKNIYFACKALNYRASKDKWDGDRPLAVYVDWKVKNDKLTGDLVFSNPLSVKGNQCGKNVQQILKSLKINKDNFDDLKHYIS
ncbi:MULTISPECIES: hypothetical protein [Colwellia]|uniref:Uncharacterized protein n=1 Tax=Colwellia marinimaniae TaxID=1513592 RepID=A0ABQ0MYG8_9GAMM|nr:MULTISPECIES: hypothetical protein [Colwellia]GAW97412.1 hypothetical protein MTCD1_03039 [Colwellia marinimaniae]